MPSVFYLQYALAELRRRRGRTLLTAMGLAVGVALVVAVTALTDGLSDAQDEVLKPLTGVGTDMTVTRPIELKGGGINPFGNLSDKEREQLQKENQGIRTGLSNLGDPGEKFVKENFATTELSFPAAEQRRIARISGVKQTAGGLTLTALRISGTVPEGAAPTGPPGPGQGGGAGPPGIPDDIKVTNLTVSGVDQSEPTLGAITKAQIARGRYFSAGLRREVIVSLAYSKRKRINVGEKITVAGQSFSVVGIAAPPLGGAAADAYVKLDQLQAGSDREGRINTVYVRAADNGQVDAIAKQIPKTFEGASVTTTKDLADRVGGSLLDAKKLASRLGGVLVAVALIASALIAALLTLASVAKRTRELGTLKAIGWSRGKVVRQVSGESLLQGLLGGLLGAALGLAAILAINAADITLKASVAADAGGGARFPGAPPGGFGQGNIVSGSSDTVVQAPIGLSLPLLAIGLAVLVSLLAGAVGGLRAARLRPAEALRTLN